MVSGEGERRGAPTSVIGARLTNPKGRDVGFVRYGQVRRRTLTGWPLPFL
jgi:hypothetical protein